MAKNKIEEKPTLNDVLVAFQKSFSKVSRDSKGQDENEARALITGAVNFEMELGVDYGDDKRIHYNPKGCIKLKLNGEIETDVRVKEISEVTNSKENDNG